MTVPRIGLREESWADSHSRPLWMSPAWSRLVLESPSGTRLVLESPSGTRLVLGSPSGTRLEGRGLPRCLERSWDPTPPRNKRRPKPWCTQYSQDLKEHLAAEKQIMAARADEVVMAAIRADPQILEEHLAVEATVDASRADAVTRLAALNDSSWNFLEANLGAFDKDYEVFS